jgi:hypothetical protein
MFMHGPNQVAQYWYSERLGNLKEMNKYLQIGSAFRVALAAACLSFGSNGQESKVSKSLPAEAVDSESGFADPQSVAKVVQTRNVAAIPSLERVFDRVRSKREKQMLAAALVALGADNPRYITLLSQYALLVIEDDLPYPLLLDSNGVFERGSHLRNRKFMDWCSTKGVTPEMALQRAIAEDPLDIRFLAMAQTPATAPILLRALQSRNWMVSSFAAQGLAVLGDSKYLAPVVEAANRVPRSVIMTFAQAILGFKSERSIEVARVLVKDQELFSELQKQRVTTMW